MESFIINGGQPLSGEIEVKGAKNAATPILAACLLTKEPCVIDNLPLIEDVFRMIDLLESMGCQIHWLGLRKIRVQAKNLDCSKMKQEVISQMRSSILLLGPLLARFRNFKISHPGGCLIGARPMDTHFDALKSLGAKVIQNENFYFVKGKKIKSGLVVLKEFSVTATENALMAACLLPGKTIIKIAACEPHVQDLVFFMTKMGAKIKGLNTHTLEVIGVKKLSGCQHKLISDSVEAGTFILMAAAVRGKILVKNLNPTHLDAVFEKLKEMKVNFEVKKKRFNQADVLVKPRGIYQSVKIQTMPYPGLPTDLQAPFGVFCTQAAGSSLIHDPLYEGRLKYIDELKKMGADAIICDPHRAIIKGATPLYGTKITSYDLRAGAGLIIAALLARGETQISDAYQVDRGYEKIEERLQQIGARIKRVK